MAYKPTGRLPGRPKTKDTPDKTISLKIPPDLLARVQHYAGIHRQSISELIRDGLEWRITEGDPRWQPLPADRNYGNTEFQQLTQPAYILDDRIPFDDDLAPGVPGEAQGHNNGITVLPPMPERTHALPVQHTEAPPQPAPALPAFDTSKYTLGKLCPRRHAHGTTGHSLLRRTNRHCLACDREKFHERKQARRLAQTGVPRRA